MVQAKASHDEEEVGGCNSTQKGKGSSIKACEQGSSLLLSLSFFFFSHSNMQRGGLARLVERQGLTKTSIGQRPRSWMAFGQICKVGFSVGFLLSYVWRKFPRLADFLSSYRRQTPTSLMQLFPISFTFLLTWN